MEEDSLENLEQLLLEITGGDAGATGSALLELSDAIKTYRASRFIIEADDSRTKPGIAEARKAMANLDAFLRKGLDALEELPTNSLVAFVGTYGKPAGKLSQELKSAQMATGQALEHLKEQPNKVADSAQRILAFQIARMFRDLLKITPTATRDHAENITFSRGGAAYARVLREVLVIVGHPNVAIGRLVDDGLALLSDPQLPQNLQ